MNQLPEKLIEHYINRKFPWNKAKPLIIEDFKDFRQAVPNMELLRRTYEMRLSIQEERRNRYGSL